MAAEHRASRRPRGPVSRAKQAAARANLARARAVLAARGWPHSEKQRAAARENIRKAQAAIRARGLPDTPARQAAAQANLAKAHARLRELGYPRSERQKDAARRNLEQSRAAGHDPKNYDRYHRHKLKHGLLARSLEQTLRHLEEDPRQFAAHQERFRRVFAPANPTEERVVRRLAAATWRHLRLFRAQARWTSDALAHYFERAAPAETVGARLTHLRGLFLMSVLHDRDKFYLHDRRLRRGVERALGVLVHLRARDDPEFLAELRRQDRDRRKFERREKALEAEYRRIEEEERLLDFQERLAANDPEAWNLLKNVGRKVSGQS